MPVGLRGKKQDLTPPDMRGLHLTSDLHGCMRDMPPMCDAAVLRALCLDAVAAVGLRRVGDAFHHFDDGGGVTGAVLLAESHLAVHTWPELGAVTLDVYVCNVGADNSGRARQLLARLEAAFAPARVQRHELRRGETGGALASG